MFPVKSPPAEQGSPWLILLWDRAPTTTEMHLEKVFLTAASVGSFCVTDKKKKKLNENFKYLWWKILLLPIWQQNQCLVWVEHSCEKSHVKNWKYEVNSEGKLWGLPEMESKINKIGRVWWAGQEAGRPQLFATGTKALPRLSWVINSVILSLAATDLYMWDRVQFIKKPSQTRESRGFNDLFVWRGQAGILPRSSLPQMGVGEPCRKQSDPFMRQIFILNEYLSYFALSSLFPEEVGPDAFGKSQGWFPPPMNPHISLRAGQCPEVSLGAGTIFWRCSSLFGPSCWQIPGCSEQLCLCFPIDLRPGDVVLDLFVSWEDVILISLIGFQRITFCLKGKGTKKKQVTTLN